MNPISAALNARFLCHKFVGKSRSSTSTTAPRTGGLEVEIHLRHPEMVVFFLANFMEIQFVEV